jgi:CubicO group peptidase (beta-lactamase class C family)
MKNNRLLAVAVFLMCSMSLIAGGTQSQEKPLKSNEKMDELFEFWNRLDQPGYAVIVVKDGQVVYQKYFGLAILEGGVPNTPKTIFNVATLAQAFTGMALAMLEKQGKLSLDDDVRKSIPDLPDFGTPITIRHLLSHSSGLHDWPSLLKLAGREVEDITVDRILKMVKSQKQLKFVPGSQNSYSATNFDLLAETIKRATSQSLRDWAWENMFKPLKMTRTQFRENYREVIENQAFSYNYSRTLGYMKGLDNVSAAGSHSLFISLEDLGKWLLNLETGQVGGRDTFQKMFSPGKLDSGEAADFAYGFHVDTYKGLKRVYETGDWAGSGVALEYYPDQKFGFVLLSNWDYAYPEYFVQDISGIFLESIFKPEKAAPLAKPKKEVKVKPAIYDQYAGDYRIEQGVVYTIVREGDRLMIRVSGQKYQLFPLSPTQFFLKVADVQITFQKSKEGKFDQFALEEGGTKIIASRVELVKPTLQQLKEFAGTYYNDELEASYSVELRNDRLVMVHPRVGEIRLSPEVQDHFIGSSAVFRMVVFSRDQKKNVAGFFVDTEPTRDIIFVKK